MTEPSPSASTDERNKAFWNELCGSQLARDLGVTDDSPESLKRFDDFYMNFYPYLLDHIPFASVKGKDVLEVGLGYGTVAQKLAEAGAVYRGLDIAAGPAAMVNHRLQQAGMPGLAVQGSILSCPYPDASFDYVVSIGCFHHTGNLQRALDEAWRVLRPGGEAMVMVYYAYSYRRWARSFGATFRHLLWDRLGIGGPSSASERERAQYDASVDGAGAPETVFVSARQMRRLCRDWTSVDVHRENTGGEGPLKHLSRETANRLVGPRLGLDIYCHLRK